MTLARFSPPPILEEAILLYLGWGEWGKRF